MGFSPEVAARYEAHKATSARWICEPGWHGVEIIAYRRSSVGRGGSVDFELRDLKGRGQTVRFSLSIPVQRGGDLMHFCAAVMGRNPAHESPLGCGNTSTFRNLVGGCLEVFVTRNGKGYYDVVGWRAPKTPV